MKTLSVFTALIVGLMPKAALAHCPLCTAGAGALAVLASSLGVSPIVVGLLIGAFALALSLWLAGLVKKQYIPEQKTILTGIIYLATILPIMPLVQAYGPFYISLAGEYGTLLHNTYTINLYILGTIFGALIMLASPYLSRLLTKLRGRQLPFQGITITFSLLVVSAAVIQLLS